MGNICRSPSAEGFFRMHAERAGLISSLAIDSAGTHSYHIGHPPDHRAIAEAANFGVDISTLRARKVEPTDFQRFDHIIAMDHDNLRILERAAPSGSAAHLSLMMDFGDARNVTEVPDPYYGTRRDFVYMCELLDQATAGLLDHIRKQFDGS